jgi:hypothetical protein
MIKNEKKAPFVEESPEEIGYRQLPPELQELPPEPEHGLESEEILEPAD